MSYLLLLRILKMTIKKIGIACHKLQYGGGMERYVIDLINGFSALNITMTCFAKKFDSSLPEYKKIIPISINTSWVPGKLRDQLYSYLLEKKRKKIDSGPLISVTRNACSQVAICGGTHIGFLKNTMKKTKMSDRLQIQLERQLYQNAQLIIAHSQLMAEELQQFYNIPISKIHVLYPPVDASRFYPAISKDALKKSLNLPLDKKIFLFPSSSHTRKGYNLLESYFSTSNLPIHLAVVGRPLPRISSNITYYGHHNDILPFYQAADFTIMASTYEPFGLVAIESIQSGTPIIVSNKLGASEVIDESVKLIFESGSLEDLDRVIHQALTSDFCFMQDVQPLINYDFSLTTHCQKILNLIDTFIQ